MDSVFRADVQWCVCLFLKSDFEKLFKLVVLSVCVLILLFYGFLKNNVKLLAIILATATTEA